MCEKRIIFVADEISTLSTNVLAASAMLYPFRWQHIFIPLLPSKLLSYTAAPVPYMIGCRRYLMARIRQEAIEDVIIVDLDSGDCSTLGGAKIKDFVGDAASSMRQATESLEKVRAKASSVATSVLGMLGSSYGGGESEMISASCLAWYTIKIIIPPM